MSDYAEETRPDDPESGLVHWMEPRHLTLGPTAISATAAGAFALGAVAAVAVLALTHWLRPRREPLPMRRNLRLH